MPRVNFPKIDDAQDFSALPEDRYVCALAGIATTGADGNTPLRTKAGAEMWDLRFAVLKGPHSGRNIYDRISFGAKALGRVKLLCSRLGIDTEKEQDVTPDLLRGRKCWVTVEIEDYEDEKGKKKQRNKVPFAGFEKLIEGEEAVAATKPADDDDLPF